MSSKDVIIDTALKLFLQKSYHEVTMQDIVQETGLSKGAFYHYFSSKEQVFDEVTKVYFGSTQLEVYSRIVEYSLWDFCQEYLRESSERMYTYANKSENGKGSMAGNRFGLIFDAMKLLPEFKKNQEERKKEELKYWTSIIAQARENGEIKSGGVSDKQIAKLFIYQNYGARIYFVMHKQVEEVINEIAVQFKAIYDIIKA